MKSPRWQSTRLAGTAAAVGWCGFIADAAIGHHALSGAWDRVLQGAAVSATVWAIATLVLGALRAGQSSRGSRTLSDEEITAAEVAMMRGCQAILSEKKDGSRLHAV